MFTQGLSTVQIRPLAWIVIRMAPSGNIHDPSPNAVWAFDDWVEAGGKNGRQCGKLFPGGEHHLLGCGSEERSPAFFE